MAPRGQIEHLEPGDSVLARVNGRSIGVRDVERLVDWSKMPPRDVLRRLEDEAVLLSAAERDHVDVDEAELERVTRRAAVQAFLEERVVHAIRDEDVDETRVRERIELDSARFQSPEKRSSSHLLVAPSSEPSDAQDLEHARAEAERACDEARSQPGAAEARLAEIAQRPSQDGLTRTYEEVPALARDADIDPGYRDALYGSAAAGEVIGPFQTSLGWHCLVLRAILPPFHVEEEERERTVRTELANEDRAASIERLTDELANGIRIERHHERLNRAFENRAMGSR